MNIVPSYPNFMPLALQPNTESARRDNTLRERIPATTQAEPYARESQVGAEKDKARSSENRPVSYQSSDTTQRQNNEQRTAAADDSTSREKGKEGSGKEEQGKGSGSGTQDQAQQKEVEAYKARDQEVRTHERAHQSAGGQYASAPSYSLSRGPDGKRYATGGEVQIDISPVSGDPAATVQKMQQVRSAALAPAEPSSQDMSVAAKASRLESQARAELATTSTSKAYGDASSANASSSSQSDASALVDEGTTAGQTSLSQSSLATPSMDPLQQRVQVIAQRYDNAWRPNGRPSFNSYA